MRHNKYERHRAGEMFAVTKSNSFDIFGNQIDWKNQIKSIIKNKKFPTWTGGYGYKSHFGFLTLDSTKMKQLWDARPKTEQERNLIYGEHIAEEISEGKRNYDPNTKTIHRKPRMNPQEDLAYHYIHFCYQLEMKIEDDKTVNKYFYNKNEYYRFDLATRTHPGTLFSFLWEGKQMTITEGIETGHLWSYEVKKAFEWIQNGKIKEEQLTPKLRLRMKYALAHEGITQKETTEEKG